MIAAIYARKSAGRCILVVMLCLFAFATAASAETGWYLMLPPIVNGAVAPERPLREWKTFDTYVSLPACLVERNRHVDALTQELHLAHGVPAYGLAVADWVQGMRSLCIASNDPRLGGQP